MAITPTEGNEMSGDVDPSKPFYVRFEVPKPIVYVPTKAGIGEALGITVGSAAASIEEVGEAESLVAEIITKLAELVK